MPAVTENSSSPVFPFNSVRGLRIALVCPTGHIPRLSIKKLFNFFLKLLNVSDDVEDLFLSWESL